MDIQNEKTYDAVFWAGVLGLTQYLVPLVNEAFGEHLSLRSGDACEQRNIHPDREV